MLIDTGLICANCGQPIQKEKDSGGTGYGENDKGEKICYQCCADEDRKYMIEHGTAVLYLVENDRNDRTKSPYEVVNWPGTLRFRPVYVKKGRHNIARTRTDVWFKGPDGERWWGVQYGENTQIIRCKRVGPWRRY